MLVKYGGIIIPEEKLLVQEIAEPGSSDILDNNEEDVLLSGSILSSDSEVIPSTS